MSENSQNERRETERSRTIKPSDILLLPSLLGVLAACAAVAAISHDIGFFYVIGIDFINILTTADLIKSTANWLVPLLVPIAIWSYWEYKSPSYSPYVNSYYETGLLNKKSIKSFWRVFNENKIFTIFSILTPINLIFLLSWYGGITVIVFAGLMLYLGRKFVIFVTSERVSSDLLPLVWNFAAIFSLSIVGLMLGIVDGESAHGRNKPVYEVRADKFDQPLAVMIRSCEKGIIVKQASKFVFVPWDNIKTLSLYAKPYDDRSLASRLYHWWIDQPPLSP